MRLWIDTEFNGFEGELISMALVADDGTEWYESLGCEAPCDWVAAHVMPIIGKESVTKEQAQLSLCRFLAQWEEVHVVADWAEDIAHFCRFLITGPGFCMPTPKMTFEIRRDINALSAVPHNALEDARGIRMVGVAT